MSNQKIIQNVIIAGAVIFLMILFIPSVIVQVDAGTVAVRLRNGAIVDTFFGEGLHFKLPIFESIVRFEARTQKKEVVADAASRDLQQIDATIALNYRIN